MTKVKINSVVPKTSKTGNPYQLIVYNDSLEAFAGAKGGDFLPFIGKEVEVEISPSKDGKSTFFTLPGTSTSGSGKYGGYSKGASDFEYRRAAIMLAQSNLQITGATLNHDSLKKEAVEMEKWLRDGLEAPAK